MQHPSSAAIGCLWLVAVLPLLSMVLLVLIFLGGQVSSSVVPV